jgi:hypothetical protein
MKLTTVLPIALVLSLFTACKDNPKKESAASENNIDAARNFIRAALDGKFDEARRFMLQDSVNTNYMDITERAYQYLDPGTKNGYRSSSIRILPPVTELNDSVSIIIYSNSYKNDPDTLRVMKANGQWLVDLKYLYEHDADTIGIQPAEKDTLR